jgi:hypothetical protein
VLGREYTTAKLPGNTGRLSLRGSPPLCRRGCDWVRFSIFRARRNNRGSRLSTWTSRSPRGRSLAPFGVGLPQRGSAGLGSRRKSSILSAMRPESVRFGSASALPVGCVESNSGSTRSIRIQTDCSPHRPRFHSFELFTGITRIIKVRLCRPRACIVQSFPHLHATQSIY